MTRWLRSGWEPLSRRSTSPGLGVRSSSTRSPAVRQSARCRVEEAGKQAVGMIDHLVQGMAVQPHAIDRRMVAEQAGPRRRAEPGPAEPAAVGVVDVEVEQPGRRPAVLDGDAGPLYGSGRFGGPQDRIGT